MSLSHNYVDDQNDNPMEEDLMTGVPVNDDLPETDTDLLESGPEDPRQEEETAKLVKEVAATIQTGLDQSEKNALNVSGAVDQVLKLTDREQYKMAMDAIFSDPSLSTEEKLRLKAAVDEGQDVKDEHATQRVTRLQASQQNTVVEILKTCGIVILVSASGASIVFLCGTGAGRKILNKVITWAIKDAPQVFNQVAV